MFHCPYAYSDITFNSELELLAGATEAGDVIVWDLYYGKEISRVRADAAGVNKLKFMKNGQLVTVGNSEGCQIKVWDFRFNSMSSISSTTSGTFFFHIF